MEILIEHILNKSSLSYAVMTLGVVVVCYKAFVIWWDLRQKQNEIKDEMDEYINELIDVKTAPIVADLEKATYRINDLDKLRLPTKLIAIETKLEILTSNVDAGFKRIEEDIRTLHRKNIK